MVVPASLAAMLKARERRALALRLRDSAAKLEQDIRFFRTDWLRAHARELEAAHRRAHDDLLEDEERPARTELRARHNAEVRAIRERVLIPRRLAAVAVPLLRLRLLQLLPSDRSYLELKTSI